MWNETASWIRKVEEGGMILTMKLLYSIPYLSNLNLLFSMLGPGSQNGGRRYEQNQGAKLPCSIAALSGLASASVTTEEKW